MTIAELYDLFKLYPKVITDSRSIIEDCLFFALKGENFNGNKFAKKAIESGAKYAVIDEAEYKLNDNYILVNDVLESLQQLALFHREQFDIPLIGITGTNGKTTTKELLHKVLRKKYKAHATKGNLNNHIGVPFFNFA